jgi:hypothetical protein
MGPVSAGMVTTTATAAATADRRDRSTTFSTLH